MSTKSALVFGATGLVGSELVAHLLESPAYGRVVAAGRRIPSESHPKLHGLRIDFADLEAFQSAFGVDHVFCCLGTTIRAAGSQEAFRRVDFEYPLRIAKMAKEAGVSAFVLVTAMGADSRSRIFYNRVKGEVEEAVAGLGLPSLHILRPSLLVGKRAESRPAERIAMVIGEAMAFLLVGPLRPYRPVHAAAVAQAARQVALAQMPGTHVYLSDRIAAFGHAGA